MSKATSSDFAFAVWDTVTDTFLPLNDGVVGYCTEDIPTELRERVLPLVAHLTVQKKPANPIKRFIAFCGAAYYPFGGCEDFAGDFNTMDEAKAELGTYGCRCEWAQILDAEERTVYSQFDGKLWDTSSLQPTPCVKPSLTP
jgi:hypothetical protein